MRKKIKALSLNNLKLRSASISKIANLRQRDKSKIYICDYTWVG